MSKRPVGRKAKIEAQNFVKNVISGKAWDEDSPRSTRAGSPGSARGRSSSPRSASPASARVPPRDVTPKRPRGRPRKHDSVPRPPKPVVETPTPVKRGRGRPPKAKRGRPGFKQISTRPVPEPEVPEVKVEIISDEDEEEEEEGEDGETPEPSTSAGAKKGPVAELSGKKIAILLKEARKKRQSREDKMDELISTAISQAKSPGDVKNQIEKLVQMETTAGDEGCVGVTKKKRPSILDGMKHKARIQQTSSSLQTSPPPSTSKSRISSPPVPEPRPLRATVAERIGKNPLDYPSEDIGQNSFCKMFGLVNKADIKVQDASKRFHREQGGKLRRVLKPRMADGMIYDKITIAKGCVIEGILDDSSEDDVEEIQSPPGSSSPRGSQRGSPRLSHKTRGRVGAYHSNISPDKSPRKKEWLKPPSRKRTSSADNTPQGSPAKKDAPGFKGGKASAGKGKGKVAKKMERVRLAPPPPPRADAADASRRSRRQRTSKRKEWWHLLRANPDEYEVDEEWDEAQEKIEEKKIRKQERDEIRRHDDDDDELEIKSEPESMDSSESSSSEDDEDVMRKLSGLPAKKKEKKKREKRVKPVSQAKARVEEFKKSADARQYADLYDEVMNLTPQQKRRPKDWALAKKVLAEAREKGLITHVKDSQPRSPKKPPAKTFKIPAKPLSGKATHTAPKRGPDEPSSAPKAKKKKKTKAEREREKEDAEKQQKSVSFREPCKDEKREAEIEHFLGSDSHASPPRERTFSPVMDFSNVVTADEEKARMLTCQIPHMCNVCWVNDHMYCKNMKRIARELPPCGGCIHYVPCVHFRPARSKGRKGLKEVYYNIRPARREDEGEDYLSYTDRIATPHPLDSDIIDKAINDDLFCHEDMIDSDSELSSSDAPQGTESLKTQLRIRERQITSSLGVDTVPMYEASHVVSVSDSEDDVLEVEVEELVVAEFGAEMYVMNDSDQNFPPNKDFSEGSPVELETVFSGIIHPPKGREDEPAGEKVRIRLMPYGSQFKMEDLEILGKHKVVKVKVQRLDDETVLLTQTAPDDKDGEGTSIVREVRLPKSETGENIDSEALGKILATEAVKLVNEDEERTGTKSKSKNDENGDDDDDNDSSLLGEPQVAWKVEGEDEEGSASQRANPRRRSKVLMKKDTYAMDWSLKMKAKLEKQAKEQSVITTTPSAEVSVPQPGKPGDKGSHTLSFSTKDIRERKPELLDYIKRAGLQGMIIEKLQKERGTLVNMIEQAEDQKTRIKNDIEQQKCMLNALLSERDTMREDIKTQSACVQEADREANAMRKRKTMLIGNKLEVDDGITMRKNLVKDIDHMIATVPSSKKSDCQILPKKKKSNPKNTQFVLVKISPPHGEPGATQTIAVPVSASTIESLKVMPKDKVQVQTVQKLQGSDHILQLTLSSTNPAAKPQTLHIKLNPGGGASTINLVTSPSDKPATITSPSQLHDDIIQSESDVIQQVHDISSVEVAMETEIPTTSHQDMTETVVMTTPEMGHAQEIMTTSDGEVTGDDVEEEEGEICYDPGLLAEPLEKTVDVTADDLSEAVASEFDVKSIAVAATETLSTSSMTTLPSVPISKTMIVSSRVSSTIKPALSLLEEPMTPEYRELQPGTMDGQAEEEETDSAPQMAAIPVSLAQSMLGGRKLNLPTQVLDGQEVVILPIQAAPPAAGGKKGARISPAKPEARMVVRSPAPATITRPPVTQVIRTSSPNVLYTTTQPRMMAQPTTPQPRLMAQTTIQQPSLLGQVKVGGGTSLLPRRLPIRPGVVRVPLSQVTLPSSMIGPLQGATPMQIITTSGQVPQQIIQAPVSLLPQNIMSTQVITQPGQRIITQPAHQQVVPQHIQVVTQPGHVVVQGQQLGEQVLSFPMTTAGVSGDKSGNSDILQAAMEVCELEQALGAQSVLSGAGQELSGAGQAVRTELISDCSLPVSLSAMKDESIDIFMDTSRQQEVFTQELADSQVITTQVGDPGTHFFDTI